jgi:hypothetical protein
MKRLRFYRLFCCHLLKVAKENLKYKTCLMMEMSAACRSSCSAKAPLFSFGSHVVNGPVMNIDKGRKTISEG